MTNFFTNRSRNHRSAPNSSSGNRNGLCPSVSPANSRRGSESTGGKSVRTAQDLPSISSDLSAKDTDARAEEKARTVFLSNRFARNLASEDDTQEINTIPSSEGTELGVAEKSNLDMEKKSTGLLRREKEKRGLVESREADDYRSRPQTENMRVVANSPSLNHLSAQHKVSSISLGQKSDVEQVRYQDALSLRYGINNFIPVLFHFCNS